MSASPPAASDSDRVRELLLQWASATRKGAREEVLANHAHDALIFDVLPPMKYEGTAAYRRSWDEWQPDTQGEAQFALEDLAVVAGADVAYAHGLLRCGGTLPDGRVFEDLVRATFCLRKTDGTWKVTHQHISQPMRR